MEHEDAVALIRGGVRGDAVETWADLGAGDGIFTFALASLLHAGSVVHAIDLDASALRRIPRALGGATIVTHAADFTRQPWAVPPVHGVLMANSLHYVPDQAGFIRSCASAMVSPRRFLIVEYDTEHTTRWVPHPLSRRLLERLFGEAGYSVQILGSRPSVFRRASIYAAVAVEGN